MISNPCTWFINGNEEKNFTYEGGKHLYHFSDNDNKLNVAHSVNVVFFADNKKHGLDVIKRMLKFRIKCSKQYIKAETKNDMHGFVCAEEEKIKECKEWIGLIEKGKVKIEKAPTNIFYKVGWADNDTI